ITCRCVNLLSSSSRTGQLAAFPLRALWFIYFSRRGSRSVARCRWTMKRRRRVFGCTWRSPIRRKSQSNMRRRPSLIDNWIERKPEHLWTDALNPSPEALGYLRERFRLHPLAIEECDHAGVRPKIEQFEEHLYIVFHGINHNPGEDRLDTIEFKIFLRPQLLITVHDKASTSIQTTQARLRRDPTVLTRHGVDTVLHHIVDAIVDHYFPLLEMMEGQLENLESEIFRSPDDHLLEAMLVLQR